MNNLTFNLFLRSDAYGTTVSGDVAKPFRRTQSPSFERFCILHEIGHLKVLGNQPYSDNYIDNWSLEYDADMYAMLNTSLEIAINALNKFPEKSFVDSKTHPSVEKRIFYLQTGIRLFDFEGEEDEQNKS